MSDETKNILQELRVIFQSRSEEVINDEFDRGFIFANASAVDLIDLYLNGEKL